MVNICTLQWKYKPCLELPENSVPRLRKPQYRNWHKGSERSWDLHVSEENQTWAYSGLENKLHNTSRSIYDCFVFLSFFVCLTLSNCRTWASDTLTVGTVLDVGFWHSHCWNCVGSGLLTLSLLELCWMWASDTLTVGTVLEAGFWHSHSLLELRWKQAFDGCWVWQ